MMDIELSTLSDDELIALYKQEEAAIAVYDARQMAVKIAINSLNCMGL